MEFYKDYLKRMADGLLSADTEKQKYLCVIGEMINGET